MTAIVFPGQGSQFIGMSKDFYDQYSEVKETYQLIEDTTKIKIKEIIFENPSDLLHQTQYTQLAIFCASISIYNVLISNYNSRDLNINFMLGHSLGEYTALCASKILSIKDTAFLLKKRGELMQNAYEPNKSGMAAIIGFDSNYVESEINSNKLNIEIANDNSPQQIVVSGTIDDLKNSEIVFKKNGAKKFILLNVSAAFHSKFMSSAQEKLNEYIKNVNFQEASISIISNFTGKICKDLDEINYNLINQMSNKVKWVESINTLVKIGEKDIIEIGPGKVLSGLIKRISDNFKIKNFNNISDIEGFNNEF